MGKENKIKMLDLFAGCGGLTDGFMQTGRYNDIAAVEWKKPQVLTLRNRLSQKWGKKDVEQSILHCYTKNNIEENGRTEVSNAWREMGKSFGEAGKSFGKAMGDTAKKAVNDEDKD